MVNVSQCISLPQLVYTVTQAVKVPAESITFPEIVIVAGAVKLPWVSVKSLFTVSVVVLPLTLNVPADLFTVR